jgi:hypothetical protein
MDALGYWAIHIRFIYGALEFGSGVMPCTAGSQISQTS